MGISKISLDEAKAMIWVMDVTNEIDAVEAVISRTSAALSEYAGTDDTVMNGIIKSADWMANEWKATCADFKGSISLIKKAISALTEKATELAQEAVELAKK